jgi:hypothetical protein
MGTLQLHITLASRKLTGGKPAILLMYATDGSEYGADRMIHHRGVTHPRLASRPAEQEEIENESHPYRFELLPYNCWEKLIADERKYTEDPEWFDQIAELRKRFPQFEHSQQPTT